MGFVADPTKQVYGTWTFGYKDGLQAWMEQNWVSDPSIAYIAAMNVQPSVALKAQIKTLTDALVAAGVWAKLDWLSLFGHMHDQQAAKLNMVNPVQFFTEFNGPVFLPGAAGGYTGNGTTMYMSSGWNPITAPSPKMSQNSCHIGAWLGTDVVGAVWDVGSAATRINSNGAGAQLRANGPVLAGVPTGGSSIGHMIANRVDAVNASGSKNGAAFTTAANASTPSDNSNMFALAYSAAGIATGYSTRRLQVVHWGAGLTQGEVTAFYNALNTFLTSPYS